MVSDRYDRDARVMKAIGDSAGEGLEWLGVTTATGLSVGTVHPILIRLEQENKIHSVGFKEGIMPRRVYRI